MTLFDRLLGVDRRWIFLFVLFAVLVPLLMPLRLPVRTTGSTRAAYEYIESLKPGDVVWLSFDYGPSSAPENDPMADAFLRHCFLKDLRVAVCALYPLGGLSLASSSVARVGREFPAKKYGTDYVNLGYKDGAEAVMRRLGGNIAEAFPTDVNGKPIAGMPIFQNVTKIGQFKMVFTVATGVIGEFWITLVNAQFGTPIIIGPTAVMAPKFYAFLSSGQLKGMFAGMKGAAEYEQLLSQGYPEMSRFYRTTRLFTATKGMDAQTGIHAVIILFIFLGNVAFLMGRRREGRA